MEGGGGREGEEDDGEWRGQGERKAEVVSYGFVDSGEIWPQIA